MALSFTNEIDGLHQNSSAPSVNIAAALIHSLFPGSIGFNLIQSYRRFSSRSALRHVQNPKECLGPLLQMALRYLSNYCNAYASGVEVSLIIVLPQPLL